MAISVRWTSKTREGKYTPLPLTAPVSSAVVEALLLDWQRSDDKGAFMTVLPVAQAAALCDLITERTGTPPKREASYGRSGKQRRLCLARIGALLGADADQWFVVAVYAVLRFQYVTCPVPRLITQEMVAAAAAQIVRPSRSE
jgi:hypothetical protein